MTASIPFTVILDDPLANSYIQNAYAPDVDPCLTEEEYDRTFEQNEELGLNDINVDDYGHVEVEVKEGDADGRGGEKVVETVEQEKAE
jgi:zinc finger protein